MGHRCFVVMEINSCSKYLGPSSAVVISVIVDERPGQNCSHVWKTSYIMWVGWAIEPNKCTALKGIFLCGVEW